MELKEVNAKITIPQLGEIGGVWHPNEAQKLASWELYVELSTRIAVIDLEDNAFLREALNSLYSVFSITREILRKHGPDVAISKEGETSVGYIAMSVLNHVIRPFLTTWHSLLSEHESRRSQQVSVIEHERTWESYSVFREELTKVSGYLYEYSLLLAKAAGTESLVTRERMNQ